MTSADHVSPREAQNGRMFDKLSCGGVVPLVSRRRRLRLTPRHQRKECAIKINIDKRQARQQRGVSIETHRVSDDQRATNKTIR